MNKYDLVVIGFGKAGKTLAGKYSSMGKSVAIVEKDAKMYGGTCINVGCIPSKSLVKSSQASAAMGLEDFQEKARLYRKAVLEKRRVVEDLRGKNYNKLNQLDKVEIILGEAHFIDRDKISVKCENNTLEITGEKFLINTGGTPVILPIEGAENNPYVYNSASLMELEELPKELVIVGGGYIGLEFASMYSGFGSHVTVLQDGAKLIPREDEDVAAEIKSILERRGVTFILGASITSVGSSDKSAEVKYILNGETHTVAANAILLATGRRPNTDGLNAVAAGIKLTDRGAIVTDDNLRTANPRIWAAGDVVGGAQFTYISLDDYRIIWSQLNENGNASNKYNRLSRKNVPYSVFLSPTFSRVGLNEKDVARLELDAKVIKMPTAAIPKAQVLGKVEGFLKAIVDNKTDEILGAMLICEDSHEMINTVKLAMDFGIKSTDIRDQIFTHPTMSEALNDLFSL